MKQYVIGVDIGGTKTSVVLASCVQEEIELLDKRKFDTRVGLGVEQAIERIYAAIDSLLSLHTVGNAQIAVGISCGGPLDSVQGVILSPPNLVGWDQIPIVNMLSERYGCKAFLQNDANACALAEWMLGAAKGHRNVVFLTYGTGLGAGLILNGALYEGASGMAGEVGHIRLERMGAVGYGKRGSFEGFCSGGGIKQLAQSVVLEKLQQGKPVSFCADINQLNDITAKQVFDAAKQGDAVALEIVDICGDYLGRGLSILIDTLNPQIVVLGTIFMENHTLLRPMMEMAIRREAIHKSAQSCRIEPATLQQLGDYAAVMTAVYGMKNEFSR